MVVYVTHSATITMSSLSRPQRRCKIGRDALDTGQTVVYHTSPRVGSCAGLVNSERQGLILLVTPCLHPLHCEAHLEVNPPRHHPLRE